jgi:hypothetical protein
VTHTFEYEFKERGERKHRYIELFLNGSSSSSQERGRRAMRCKGISFIARTDISG